ncbi:MAG: PQQ-binding-like beta-propeller repeat protein [Rhizobiales bacterium]|nr:PQQ-binding-like beta-propeller repeat protein [Hyphomicrobiales bacterium]
MAMTGIGDLKVPLAPALAGDSVVAVGHAGSVHLLDGATGRLIWTQTLADKAGASACDGQPVSVTVADDVVLAGAMGHVFALKLEDGAVLWHAAQRSRGEGQTSLAVGGSVSDYVARLES